MDAQTRGAAAFLAAVLLLLAGFAALACAQSSYANSTSATTTTSSSTTSEYVLQLPTIFPSTTTTLFTISFPGPVSKYADLCGGYSDFRQRMLCRVDLPAYDEFNYEPEECRGIGNFSLQQECWALDLQLDSCLSLSQDSSRFNCAASVLNLSGSIPAQVASCQMSQACLQGLRKRVYELSVFRFTNLEHNARVLRSAGVGGTTVLEFFAYTEQAKLNLLNAPSALQAEEVVIGEEGAWQRFLGQSEQEILEGGGK